MKSWKEDFNGIQFTELKSRKCNDQDFDGSGAFWPLHEKYLGFVNYRKKMKCIDEPYQIWGDYDADIASNLMVVFDRCNSTLRDDCKSDAEYAQWLQGKYIFVLENEKTFI